MVTKKMEFYFIKDLYVRQKHLVGNCSLNLAKQNALLVPSHLNNLEFGNGLIRWNITERKFLKKERKNCRVSISNEKPEFKKIRKVIGKESSEF